MTYGDGDILVTDVWCQEEGGPERRYDSKGQRDRRWKIPKNAAFSNYLALIVRREGPEMLVENDDIERKCFIIRITITWVRVLQHKQENYHRYTT